jgi:hypothetical protein
MATTGTGSDLLLGDIGRDPRASSLLSNLRNVGCGWQRETVASFQLFAADLVNPTEYKTERERDRDTESHYQY